jgi:hypothetical protein
MDSVACYESLSENTPFDASPEGGFLYLGEPYEHLATELWIQASLRIVGPGVLCNQKPLVLKACL